MAARNKPYDQFGPYILFKKLESDSLGDLWRAGRIDDGQLGPTVALRRLSGGHRSAFIANVGAIAQILPRLTGASFVRNQHAGVIDGVPHLAWDYAGGRSLRFIIDRARGGKDVQPNPLPLDQAMIIAERVALSLSTMADLKDSTGARLSHGALIPQFIWISDDGEIRVAGQQLGAGMLGSLSDPKVSPELARFFSPEYRASGQTQKDTDVYSLGAVLFLLVTGQEPPDAATASAFGAAVRAAKTTAGAPIPDDIRVILDKSFNIDPSMRYPTMAEMKQAISALAHGGRYSATTFNLAFYLSTLLKKEMEGEALDREKEGKVNVAPYLEAPRSEPAQETGTVDAAPMFLTAGAQKPKSKMPIVITVVVVMALLGVAGVLLKDKFMPAPAVKQIATAATATTLPAPRVISEPIAVAPATATTGSADSAAQKKAFEDAVRQKLQSEMMKLQDDFMAELKQKQSKNAPVAAPPAPSTSTPAPVETPTDNRPAITAAQLDQQRRDAATDTRAPAPAPVPVQPAPTVAQTATTAPAPAPVKVVREGDVVEAGLLDSLPTPLRPIHPVYPPLAARQRIHATIIVSALIDEAGNVSEVKVLRGDERFGLNDAAIRALRGAKFSPPRKDGKRVKTWYPQTIEFVPN
jgi:protein TonB